MILKCLQKELPDRYPDAEQVLSDLRKLKSRMESGEGHLVKRSKSEIKKSIIILPFDDLSPGKDNEYFSDGLMAEIISDLVANCSCWNEDDSETLNGMTV